MKATMEIRDLRMFMALAEELHFGRAAERLRISQPPLTKHIQQLEEQLGVMLFDRNKRSVRLTPAGAALVQEARRILNQAEVALQVVRRAQQGETGTLRIGFVAAVVYIGIEALFAGCIANWRAWKRCGRRWARQSRWRRCARTASTWASRRCRWGWARWRRTSWPVCRWRRRCPPRTGWPVGRRSTWRRWPTSRSS